MTIDLWRAVFGAIIGMVTYSLFTHLTRGIPSHGPVRVEGEMRHSKVYVAGSVIAMGGMGVLFLGPWVVTRSPLPTFAGMVFLVLALVSLTGLSSVFRATWDASGITAPASFYGMPWPGTRRFFAWDALVSVRPDLSGN